jgi:cell wall-associated NlpC family hydrolase
MASACGGVAADRTNVAFGAMPPAGRFHESFVPVGLRVAALAEEWIDVPFHWQGTVRAGCDCKGLVAGIARELGRPEADSVEALAGDYGGKVDVARLKAGLARMFDRASDRQPGDVLLLRMGGLAQHLAICAPTQANVDRIIEAMPSGPGRVRPARAGMGRIDSIWRWKEIGLRD